jgi:hypothetical protein
MCQKKIKTSFEIFVKILDSSNFGKKDEFKNALLGTFFRIGQF